MLCSKHPIDPVHSFNTGFQLLGKDTNSHCKGWVVGVVGPGGGVEGGRGDCRLLAQTYQHRLGLRSYKLTVPSHPLLPNGKPPGHGVHAFASCRERSRLVGWGWGWWGCVVWASSCSHVYSCPFCQCLRITQCSLALTCTDADSHSPSAPAAVVRRHLSTVCSLLVVVGRSASMFGGMTIPFPG